MPVSFPSALKERCMMNPTTVQVGVYCVRKDGFSIGLTSYPQRVRIPYGTQGVLDVPMPGIRLEPAPGIIPKAIVSKSSLEVDNSQFDGFLTPDIFDERELESGLWEDAKVLLFVFDPAMISAGTGFLGYGRAGKAKFISDGSFSIELRSLEDFLQQPIGDRISKTCRNPTLGQGTCPVNLDGKDSKGNDLRANVQLTSVPSLPEGRTKLVSTSLTSFPDHHFDRGMVFFMSGENEGVTREVREFDNAGILYLWEPVPKPLAVEDSIRVDCGCDKRWETCIGRYALHGAPERFNGEPFVLGEEVYAVREDD